MIGKNSWAVKAGHLTNNGERLLNVCAPNELKVEGSLFCNKNIKLIDLEHLTYKRIRTSEAVQLEGAGTEAPAALPSSNIVV